MTKVYCKDCHYSSDNSECRHFKNVVITETPIDIEYTPLDIEYEGLNRYNSCDLYKKGTIFSAFFGDGAAFIAQDFMIGVLSVLLVAGSILFVSMTCGLGSFIPLLTWIGIVVSVFFSLMNSEAKYHKKIRQHSTEFFTTEDPIWDDIAQHMSDPQPKKDKIPQMLDDLDIEIDRRQE